MDSLIFTIATKSGDNSFEDFEKKVYKHALLTAKRIVARKYRLVERLYEFEATSADDERPDIILPIPSFDSEYRVLINGIQYRKVDMLTPDSANDYVLWEDYNKLVFNYFPRSEKDNVRIYYKADINKEDYEVEELAPIIPSRYNEELVKFALIEIAKLGLVKYSGTQKERKYQNLFQLYSESETNLDKDLIKNDSWASIKVYNVI